MIAALAGSLGIHHARSVIGWSGGRNSTVSEVTP